MKGHFFGAPAMALPFALILQPLMGVRIHPPACKVSPPSSSLRGAFQGHGPFHWQPARSEGARLFASGVWPMFASHSADRFQGGEALMSTLWFPDQGGKPGCVFNVMLVFPNVNHSGNLEFQLFPFFGGPLQAKPKETTTNSCVILRKTRASISEQLAAPLTASVATNASMRILRFSIARSASKGCAPNAVNITVGRKPRHHIRWPNWRNNRNIHFTELPCVPVITESWNSFVRVAMWCAAVTVSQQNTKLASLFQNVSNMLCCLSLSCVLIPFVNFRDRFGDNKRPDKSTWIQLDSETLLQFWPS